MQYQNHIVNGVEDGNFPNEIKIILESEDPDGRYRNWYLDYNTGKNGPAPVEGATINFDAKQNDKKYWRCWGWEPGDPNESKTNGAQQIAQALPDNAIPAAPPVQIQSGYQPSTASVKEAGMFVMGTIGRWVGNQEEFPSEDTLVKMVKDAKNAFLKGMQ